MSTDDGRRSLLLGGALTALAPPASQASPRMIDLLDAPGPDPALEEPLRLFGRFVGGWDIHWTGIAPDGSRQTARGEVHFGWVLEGRAIQDVWIFPSRDLRGDPLPPQ